MARVLIPLPDIDFEVGEAAVPWKVLTRAGHEVVFATEEGGRAPQADPRLIDGVIFGKLGADAAAKAVYAEMTKDPAFQNPIAWSAIEPVAFDALVLPGGHAPGMKQYLGSALLQEKVGAFWALERPVAAICHGPVLLARTKDPRTGKSVLHGVKTTSLPKYMERSAFLATFWKLGRYYRTYPEYVEDEVRAALARPEDYVRGPFTLSAKGTEADDTNAFVVEDGRYVSARWPGDSWLFAKKIAERLAVRARAAG